MRYEPIKRLPWIKARLGSLDERIALQNQDFGLVGRALPSFYRVGKLFRRE